MLDNDKLICIGVVSGAHGIRGHVAIRSFTTTPEDIVNMALLDPDGNEISLKYFRKSKKDVICSISHVKNRNDAEALKGMKLYAKRSSLPHTELHEYYIEDLTGIKVLDTLGNHIGKILAVHNFGAGDIIEVKFLDKEKKSQMYPFTAEIFPEVDITQHIVMDMRKEL